MIEIIETFLALTILSKCIVVFGLIVSAAITIGGFLFFIYTANQWRKIGMAEFDKIVQTSSVQVFGVFVLPFLLAYLLYQLIMVLPRIM